MERNGGVHYLVGPRNKDIKYLFAKIGYWYKAVLEKRRTWRMTSPRSRRKFKNKTGKKVRGYPGAGWKKKRTEARDKGCLSATGRGPCGLR